MAPRRRSTPGGVGGPGVSRTPGTRFRKPLLYPSELRGPGGTLLHVSRFAQPRPPFDFLRFFYGTHLARLLAHGILIHPSIPLGRDHAGVPQDLLKGSERAAGRRRCAGEFASLGRSW